MPAGMPRLVLAVAGVAGVPEHAHCEICATTVAVGERRCGSEACEKKFQEAVKAKKRGMWMFIGLIFILLILTTLRPF
jgi:predicted nucleic acid-binding Zn ribbon protein